MDPNENPLVTTNQRILTPSEMTDAIAILEADSRRIRPLLAVSVILGIVNIALKLFLPFGLPAHMRAQQPVPVDLTSTHKANPQP